MPLFFSKYYKNSSDKAMQHLQKIVSNPKKFEQYVYEKFSGIETRQKTRLKQAEYQWQKALKNEKLNRYCNILPFDRNRVQLKGSNDYVNASYIVPPLGLAPTYLAAQGPLRHTVSDFWRMTVEQDVSVIVCLTPAVEKGIEKCARYWPEGDEELKITSEGLVMTLKNSEKETFDTQADSVVRQISIEVHQQNKLVYQTHVVQLHFVGWPDHGVPQNPDKVLALIHLARTFYKDNQPALVHCSAGCGRTGTFCVIDSAERMTRQQLGPVDPVLYLTEEFRKQRTTMVQTVSQFSFCYSALLQALSDKQ
ncbi:protein-tyrosine phosphatase-like protein [Sporodiniella umbellata]|nr:protein-tyrosine phosphatase-like protein [Sporodiniella umbellata]